MPISHLVNEGAALEILRRELNQSLLAAAEPLVQEALRQAEAAMRRQLAAHIVAMVEGIVDVHRNSRNLVITLRDPAQQEPHHGR